MAPALDHRMRRAMDLAWESFRSGSLGVGAVIARHDEIVVTGRNRLAEWDAGDDHLAGSSVAHAEMNALAKLRWGADGDGLCLWTTLQPCLQCLGAIRLSTVDEVQVLAPDPLFRGVEAARHLNEHIAKRWPRFVQVEITEWAVLALLLQTHFNRFWGVALPAWDAAIPSTAMLAGELVESGELLALAAEETLVEVVADALWPRLSPCVGDVVRLAEQAPFTDW